MIPALDTATFRLRPLGPEHATPRYLGWLQDPEINRNLETDGASQTLDTIRAYIASHDSQTRFLFGIFTGENLLIGTHSFRWYPSERRATVGVMIGDKAFWGRAVPLETRARLLDWAFNELGCDKVDAGCYANNLPAVYNFKRQRWTLVDIRKDQPRRAHPPTDLFLFTMTCESWRRERG